MRGYGFLLANITLILTCLTVSILCQNEEVYSRTGQKARSAVTDTSNLFSGAYDNVIDIDLSLRKFPIILQESMRSAHSDDTLSQTVSPADWCQLPVSVLLTYRANCLVAWCWLKLFDHSTTIVIH